MSSTERVQRLTNWLLYDGAQFDDPASFLAAYAQQLVEEEIDVDRILIGTLVTHPQASAYGFTWSRDDGQVGIDERDRESFAKLRYPGNPIDRCNGRTEALHIALGAESKDPVEASLYAGGFRDFVGVELRFGGQFQGAVTYASRRSGALGGVADELFELRGAVNACIRSLVQGLCQQTLLRTYLGYEAGSRVHRGEVKRGDRVAATSALWFSDLRGFTSLSSALPQVELLELLNQVFDVIVEEVKKQGGEVLKFMGDGVLAIFREQPGEGSEGACARAYTAAAATQVAMATLSTRRQQGGLAAVAIGIGLHYGEVSYGNIGAESRLDFTVIGPAVNLAARIEGMCSKLGQDILMSAELAEKLPVSCDILGRYELKGVPAPVTILSPAPT